MKILKIQASGFKSELFQSAYLENTTPSYEAYINLKRSLKESVKKEVE